MTKQERKKTAQQYLAEERRRQVAIMVTQSYSEVEIAAKLGVDNSTISKDIKALKLISQQFIYDITKSDFTYYYKQCLDAAKLILRKQYDIVDKERITKEDVWRAKILADMLNTVSTINEYYKAAPDMHQTPMQRVLSEERFGIRPGSNAGTHVLTDEEMKAWEEDEATEEAAELKALEEEHLAGKDGKYF
jgi:IS30 family transposase